MSCMTSVVKRVIPVKLNWDIQLGLLYEYIVAVSQYRICSSFLISRTISTKFLPQQSHLFKTISLSDSHFQSLLYFAIYSYYCWMTNTNSFDSHILLYRSPGFHKPRSFGKLLVKLVHAKHHIQHLKPQCFTNILGIHTKKYACIIMCQMHAEVPYASKKKSWITFLVYCFTSFENVLYVSIAS